LFRAWKSTNKFYKNAPINGAFFDVDYVDTNQNEYNHKQPLVLALHGVPGSHQDFGPLIKHLYPKGVRVIAPNFPGSHFVFCF